MQYVDFLKSEYDWCLFQYANLGLASYMERAMVLEELIRAFYENSTVDLYIAA